MNMILVNFCLNLLILFHIKLGICDRKIMVNYIERKIDCWPKSISKTDDDSNFKIKFYFSSKKQTDHLYTLDKPFDSEVIDFDPKRRTAVLVHGFLGEIYGDPLRKLRKKLLEWVRKL